MLKLREFYKGILLKAQTSDISDNAAGSLWYNSTANRIKAYLQGAIRTLVSKDQSQTLTNKTIDGDTNTVQDLALTSLKTNLTDASKFIVRDAAGIPVSNTKAVPTGDVVGTSDTQILTGKTLDGDDNTVQDLALTSLKTNLTDASKFIVRDAAGIPVSNTKAVPTGDVVGTSDTQALTNKTLDGDLNTVQDLALTSIKTVLADASKFIVRDAAGIPVSNTKAVPTGDVVGTSDSQILTNKTVSRATNTLSGYTNNAVPTADGSGVLGAGVAPGTAGNVLTSDGANWTSSPSGTAPDQSYELSNLSLACTVGAGALTIALKDKTGSDPSGGSVVKIGFRNATAATGTYNQRTVSAALSLVVSSGSTLGTTSGNAHYLNVYALDNAGTVELAISQTLYPDYSIQSTSAEGGAGAADSNSTIYSTTARSNVPIRLLGRLTSTQVTAGTWALVPSEISLNSFGLYANDLVSIKYSDNSGLAVVSGTQITFNIRRWDSHGAVTTGRFTVPIAGYYQVNACCDINSADTADTGRFQLGIYINAALVSAGAYTNTSATGNPTGASVSDLIRVNAGDIIDIRFVAVVGDGSVALSPSAESNYFSAIKIKNI